MWLCQESRETLIALQRGRYCIATEALLRCETAVTGVPGGPYGKKTVQKTCVKKAERALRLFWFEKNKMRFFQNYHNIKSLGKGIEGAVSKSGPFCL